MKKLLLLLSLSISFYSSAQQLTLRKGVIMDKIKVMDTISESFALYLPSSFEPSKQLPVLFVYDMQGRARQAISMFAEAAEKNNYVLAASNNINDTLSLSNNVLISKRMFNTVFSLLPIQKGRVYTAGFAAGARTASIMTTFLTDVKGVISCGSPIANTEVLSSKNPFHFIGIVGVEDFNYRELFDARKKLNLLKFPNQVLVFEGGHKWPPKKLLFKALDYLDLNAMKQGLIPKDQNFIERVYQEDLLIVNTLVAENKPVLAMKRLEELIPIYSPHHNIDPLKDSRKILRRSSNFRNKNRSHSTYTLKELFKKEDYDYYLGEDIITYNYNNLGWWNYQMAELKKHQKSPNIFQSQMGIRLEGYINALIDDNVDIVEMNKPINEEALNFLWMLKTITAPNDYSNYLKVISLNAKVEDYGTALFYLEELLKKGYTNTDELYALEHTALLRITTQFNELVAKYLEKSRYEIIEE